MGDRELLELAAKAAGYNAFAEHAAQMLESGWNPLEDDGDALRLAVTLGMKVLTGAYETRCLNEFMDTLAYEKYREDKNSATRRAIVRAAAKIGEGML